MPTNLINSSFVLSGVTNNPDGSLSSSGGSGWQLPVGNYVTRVIDPELIFPRPDSETAAWAKHRRHHPNVPYRIPIGVSFGSWPFFFEVISAPSGATVGGWLTESGDKLIVGDDYGVVQWDNPVAGNHSFHIRVHFQDGYTPLDVQWTLEVTTVGTIFIDPIGGNDSTGDGTIGNPFQTIESWYESDHTLKTFTGYQVCYRAGTHALSVDNTTQGITAGSVRMDSQNKPLVHYAYPSEAVTFDMDSAAFTLGFPNSEPVGKDGSDAFFGGIIFDGYRAGDNPRQFAVFSGAKGDRAYTAGQSGQRMTWFETTHQNMVVSETTTNNAGILWATNPSTGFKRHYWLMSGTKLDTVKTTPSVSVNFNGFYVSGAQNHLAENFTVIDCNFGKGAYANKTVAVDICLRNHDYTLSPTSYSYAVTGSYDTSYGGLLEISYSKLNVINTETQEGVLMNNEFDAYDSQNSNFKPVYLVRNSFNFDVTDTGGQALLRTGGGWPFYMYGNFCQVDDMFHDNNEQENENSADSDDYIHVPSGSSAYDANLDLQGSSRTSYLGRYGAEVAA